MISEKKEKSKKYWLSSFSIFSLVVALIGFVYFTSETTKVQAQKAEGNAFLYDNGGLATGTVSDNGVMAPANAQWSELQHPTGNTTLANTLAGVSCSVSTTAGVFRCADDFTVPAGQTWTIDQVVTFAYQTGFAGSTSPISAATLQIWNGRPGDGGSTIIFGDTTTNRLASSTDSGFFRIFNSVVGSGDDPPPAPATNRRIWQNNITVSPALVLTEGTYWIDWNTQIGTSSAHFAPPVTIPGTRGLAGWNARQFTTTGWQDVVDAGRTPTGNPDPPDIPQDFPFKLVGSSSGSPVFQKPNVDFDGDGISDFSVVRDETPALSGLTFINRAESARYRLKMLADRKGQNNLPENGTGAGATLAWYNFNSGSGTFSAVGYGTATTDVIVPADYDGDGKTDVAVWRATSPTTASFFILESSTGTTREEQFGQEGDNAQVVGDYDGDGAADVAVFRCPSTGGQCFFFYRGSDNNPNGDITYIPWGNGEPFDFFPNVGDFDGDGKNDFCLQRESPDNAAQGQFVLLRSSDFGVEYIDWGTPDDFIIPGDYDGDGQSDFMVRRNGSSPYQWFLLERDGGGTGASPIFWGIEDDIMAPGDYDGDGSQDIAVWRPSADPDSNFFFVRRSSDGALQSFEWGIEVDVPTANWYVQ